MDQQTEGVHIQHARNGGDKEIDLIKWMDITKRERTEIRLGI